MYDQIIQKIHANNIAKGWYAKPRTDLETLTLIGTEISEAIEEVRDGKPLVYVVTISAPGELIFKPDDFSKQSTDLKPEGTLVELADAVIRALDFFGYKKWNVDEWVASQRVSRRNKLAVLKETLLEACGRISVHPAHALADFANDALTSLDKEYYCKKYLARMVLDIEVLCEEHGYRLLDILEFKHKYNTTRSFRHGGKKA